MWMVYGSCSLVFLSIIVRCLRERILLLCVCEDVWYERLMEVPTDPLKVLAKLVLKQARVNTYVQK